MSSYDSLPDDLETLRTRLVAAENSLAACREWATELERYAEEGRELGRTQDEFMYALSHDLRAPLKAISGYSMLIIEKDSTNLTDQQRHYLARIAHAAKQIEGHLDKILSLSRLARRDINRTIGLSLFRLLDGLDTSEASNMPPRFSVRCGDDVQLYGDEWTLKEVLKLLLADIRELFRVDCLEVDVSGKLAGDRSEVSLAIRHEMVVDKGHVDRWHRSSYSFPVFARIIARHGGSVQHTRNDQLTLITFSLPCVAPRT